MSSTTRRPSPLSARLRLERLECRTVPATVSVNATANVHPIDPNIYGTAFASTAQLGDLNLPLNRNGLYTAGRPRDMFYCLFRYLTH